MWYEILPCVAIITGAITLPVVINYNIQKWWQNGNPYRRELYPAFNKDLYLRDLRLNGDPYKPIGLENIPDAK